MNQFASDLGSESTDMLLIPDDFEQQVAECQHFLKSLRTQPEFPSLEDPLPSSQWKELAMFEITYVELKVWLDRTRSLIQNRRNTSLSRCESYLTQDCLTELTMRETDLNRLRTLSANLNRPRGCQTLGDLKLTGSRSSTRVAAEMEEVELLWELTTAELAKQSYQCNYERTIRDVELDIREAEAKLRSVQRRALHLQHQLSMQGSSKNDELAYAMRDLKIQHSELKNTTHTLAAVNDLLNRVFHCAADPVVRSVTEILSITPLPLLVERDTDRLRDLTLEVKLLNDACLETWLCQLDLRERWKSRSRNQTNSKELHSTRIRRLSLPEIPASMVESNPFIDNVLVPHSVGPPSLRTWQTSPDIPVQDAYNPSESHFSHAMVPGQSKTCTVIEDGHISAAPQPSTSPALSVLCKESGLGSDSDHTPLSSPASVLDSIRIRQTAGAPQSKIWDPRSETLRTARDSGAKPKPPQRAISLDCVWNPGVTLSDSDLESQVSDTGPVSSEHYYTALERTPTKPEHDAISDRRSTRERSQTCDLFPRRSLRRLTMGCITHQLSAPRSDASDLYAPDMNTMEDSDTSTSHQAVACEPMPVAICSPANSGTLPRYASSPADDQRRPLCNRISLSAIMNSRDDTDHLDLNGLFLHDDIDETTFSELIPSVTEPDTGSLISSAFAVRNSFDNLPDADHPDMNGWMGNGNDNVKHTTQNVHDVRGSGIQACTALLEPASEGLEWDDSGDLRGLQPRPDSTESRFGRFSLPLIEGFGSHPGSLGTRAGSGATIFSGMEQIPVDKPYRSAFTLAAEAAEALVTGRGRYLTQQHLQQQQQLPSGSDKNKLHSGRLSEKSLTGVIPNRLSAHSVRTSGKEPSPPVCCSTPAQRLSDVRVDRRCHPNPKFENAWPTSSESPTIPVQRIRSSRGHVLSSTAKVHPVQFGQHSQPIPGESTETIHSLFSNAPMRHGLTAQTDTSRSHGDLNGRTNDSIRFNDEAAERKFEECSENPLAQLALIRSRDAVPLLGLLDRLERGSAVHLSQSDLPKQPKGALETSTQELDQERVQLDIDRSFLQFYTKELRGWRELAETLRHSMTAGNSFGAHNTFTDSDPYQTQLAVDAFCDWLSVLENRVEVCLSHLNRRATWIDQLTGFSHELKSSFAVVEERVKNSLRRARDLLLTWRERCYSERAEKPCEVVLSTQSNGRSDEPVAQIDQRQMLETLDDLQNLSDGVLTFQVRLGSCHLVNDCWGSNGLFQPVPHTLREPQLSKDCVSISNDAEQISDGASFSSSFSSFLDAEVDAEPNCTESTHLRLVTERAERLQRRLRATIRRLERTVIASTGTSSVQNVSPADHSPSVAVTSNKMTHTISSTSVIPSHHLSLCLSPPSRKHAFLPKYLLFPFLTFIVLLLALLCSYYLMMGSTSSLLRMDHPFCPRLPGRVVVDFSPNWWVRMLACLQLPSAQDITW